MASTFNLANVGLIPANTLLFTKVRPDHPIPSAFNVCMYYTVADVTSSNVPASIQVYDITGTTEINAECIVGMITPLGLRHGLTYHATSYIPFNPDATYRSYADTR